MMNNSGGGSGVGDHHAPDCTTAACTDRCPLRLLLANVEAQCPQVTQLMVAQGRDEVAKMANYLAYGIVTKDPTLAAPQQLPKRPPPKQKKQWPPQRAQQKRGFS